MMVPADCSSEGADSVVLLEHNRLTKSKNVMDLQWERGADEKKLVFMVFWI